MSREIKFRIWDGEDMSQPTDYEPYITRLGKVTDIWWNGRGAGLRDELLLQYTGLKDKEETEVYEGDIVEYGELFHGELKSKSKGVVIWNNHVGSFQISYPNINNQYVSDFIHKFEIVKVLGNVYQHKHLLDGKV